MQNESDNRPSQAEIERAVHRALDARSKERKGNAAWTIAFIVGMLSALAVIKSNQGIMGHLMAFVTAMLIMLPVGLFLTWLFDGRC